MSGGRIQHGRNQIENRASVETSPVLGHGDKDLDTLTAREGIDEGIRCPESDAHVVGFGGCRQVNDGIVGGNHEDVE